MIKTGATLLALLAALAGTSAVAETEAPALNLSSAGASTDWTGFYGGLQIGGADAELKSHAGATLGTDSAMSYGVHFGYNHDLGQWVVGAELAHDRVDLAYTVPLIGGATRTMSEEHGITRLKLKAGYDLGTTLAYATVGIADMDTSGIQYKTGTVLGLGLAWKATPQVIAGVELLHHQFDPQQSLTTIEATTVNLRVSYKF